MEEDTSLFMFVQYKYPSAMFTLTKHGHRETNTTHEATQISKKDAENGSADDPT